MDPQARRDDDDLELRDFADDKGEYLGDLSEEELMAVLKDAEESGVCEQSFEEIFDDLFERHFGKEALIEARKARSKS